MKMKDNCIYGHKPGDIACKSCSAACIGHYIYQQYCTHIEGNIRPKVNYLTKEVTLTEVEYRRLALTWEDIANIDQLITAVCKSYANGNFDYDGGRKTFYEEVLRRFKEVKK